MKRKKIIKLLEEKKFSELKNKINEVKCADIAEILKKLEDKQAFTVFRLLNKRKAGIAFSFMDSEMQEKMIKEFSDGELKDVLDILYMDDTVDLVEDMPSKVVTRILQTVSKEDRQTINKLLKYPDDSAGSIMTTEFVDLEKEMTVEEALERIKELAINSETIYTCYVLDKLGKLVGTVNIKDILIADREKKIEELMDKHFLFANVLDNQEEVAKIFDKYDIYALPVVDNETLLVGIITVDDAIDVIQEEMSKDFEIMGALKPKEKGYFETSVFEHAKNRIVWLLVLMFSAILTGAIISKYENAFAVVPLLVSFIPMIMDTGGNCGAQSSTLIIRGLATDEIRLTDIFRIIWKEIRVAILVGIVLAIVNGLRIYIQYKDIKMACTIGCTLIATAALAKTIGCLLPMLAKKIKLDPAIMAAPLITTLVDTFSILIYFNIATQIMGIK